MAVDVLFVCLHGAAKSVIATEHFRRLAQERGLAVTASAAGVDPDPEVPDHVVTGLASDGLLVSDRTPGRLTDAVMADSCLVVTLGCGIEPLGEGAVLHWGDIPDVSDGYVEARDVIVSKVTALVDGMVSQAEAERPRDR